MLQQSVNDQRSRLLLAGLIAIGLATPIIATAQSDQSRQTTRSFEPDQAGFRKTVAPFVAAHCLKCHGAEKQAGKLALHQLGNKLLGNDELATWQAMSERLKAGEMPPEGEKQPDPDTIKQVTDWIDAQLAKAGGSGVIAAGSLRSGNHVPHHLLFGPQAAAALQAPPRLWRISPNIYDEMVKKLGKNVKVGQPFAVPPGDGFKDQASGFTIDESTAAQLMRNADLIVSHQLGLSKGAKALKEFQPLLDDQTPPTPEQVDRALRKQFQIVLHRPPTADELRRFADLHAKNRKTGGAVIGARTTLMAVLLLPEANFRLELGEGPADGQGRRMLAPRELAFAVAYALTDRPPDGTLLAAADKGKLDTKDDVAREVRRLLDDPKVDKPRILRFFREYFGYAEAVNVFKDQKDNRDHEPRALVEDTDELIRTILKQDKHVFAELLTTNKTFVAHKTAVASKHKRDKQLEQIAKTGKRQGNSVREIFKSYNLQDFPLKQPIELPAEERAGVLTQPAWLVAFSENVDNHAIRRGKWVRERLLGGTVPDLPIDVDAQLPEDEHKTLRQRMEITQQKYCWQCHQKMNPLGLTFENFDGFGRHRSSEQNKPVDATGAIEHTGDKQLEGPVRDSLEMIRKLAKSDRARQVFVRHAFRYWLGREEVLGDARSLQAADRAYVESGGSMKALITALLTSEAFLYRTVAADSAR